VSHGVSALLARHDVGEAVHVAKEAAARREQELDEELRTAGRETADNASPSAPERPEQPSTPS
jgi:hypothetical protein